MTARRTVTTTNNTYNPVTPLTATVSSSMSQDVITTADWDCGFCTRTPTRRGTRTERRTGRPTYRSTAALAAWPAT